MHRMREELVLILEDRIRQGTPINGALPGEDAPCALHSQKWCCADDYRVCACSRACPCISVCARSIRFTDYRSLVGRRPCTPLARKPQDMNRSYSWSDVVNPRLTFPPLGGTPSCRGRGRANHSPHTITQEIDEKSSRIIRNLCS